MATKNFAEFDFVEVPPPGSFSVGYATDSETPREIRIPFTSTVSPLDVKTVISSGEWITTMAPASGAFNGATLKIVGGKVVGWTIPNGQKGDTTNIITYLPITAAERAKLVGKTIRLKLKATAAVGYLASKPFTTNTVNAVRSTTPGTNVGTLVENVQNGTEISRQFDYVVTAADLQIGIVNQISTANANNVGDWDFEITSLTFVVLDGAGTQSPSDLALSVVLEELGVVGLAATVSANKVSSDAGIMDGKIWSPAITSYRWDNAVNNGATARTTGNPAVTTGVNIPAGATGIGSYQTYKIALGDYPAGTRIRFATYLETSSNLNSTFTSRGVGVSGLQGDNQQVAGSTSATQLSENVMLLQGDYITQGSPKELMGLYLAILGSAAGAGARYFTHTATFVQVVSAPAAQSPNTLAAATRESADGEIDYINTVTVAPSGADYTTLTAAFQNIVGRSDNKWGLVLVAPGVYPTLNAAWPPFVRVIGLGSKPEDCWIKGELPDDVAPAQTGANQTAWINETGDAVNIRLTCRNMRYPFHSDSGASNNRARMAFIDCIIQHFGNKGAFDYQTSTGGNPSAVWTAVSAFGCGTHSGQKILSKNTIWIAPSKAFYVHDSVNWTEDCEIELDGGAVIGLDVSGYSCDIKYLGSNRKTIFRVRPGTLLRGPINIDDKTGVSTGWLNTSLAVQPSNRMQGVLILEGGAANVSWTSVQTNCVCLELRGPSPSATTPFVLSGDAAVSLFGPLADYRPCTTLPARTAVYSDFAITSDVNASVGLPSRLGDKTAAPQTLNVACGALSGSIVLDQNYGAMANNAAVITALNAKLVAAGLSTITFNTATPYDERALVLKNDLEMYVKNTDAGTIARGNGVAINVRQGEVKLMVSATTAAEFAGVALEDIPAGSYGRVLRAVKGAQISQTHLVLSGVTAALGVTIGPGATAGAFSSGGVAVLHCVETGRTSRPFTIWECI